MSNQNLPKILEVLDEIKNLTTEYLNGIDQSYYNQDNYQVLKRFSASVIEIFRHEISENSNLLGNNIFLIFNK